jgi:hypothetical protein
VGSEVEDLEHHTPVGAACGEEPPIGVDGRSHELAVLGHQTVTDWLDDLVVGDLEPVGVLGTDGAVTEGVGRGVGNPTTGKSEGHRADQGDSDPAVGDAELFEGVSRDAPPLLSDLHDHPFEELTDNRSTRPSICHKGLGVSPVGVRTWK